MSNSKDLNQSFLQRWSQRKRVAGKRKSDRTDSPEHTGSPEHKEVSANSAPQDKTGSPVLDLAALPPIESITGTTDIRAFLAPGVPEELTRAALRRAWLVDSTIRDFIGIAENQWDFTNPDGVPGFGSLQLTPNLRRFVASLIGDVPETLADEEIVGTRVAQLPEVFGQPSTPAEASTSGVSDSLMDQSMGPRDKSSDR
jgi:hypothetical protein